MLRDAGFKGEGAAGTRGFRRAAGRRAHVPRAKGNSRRGGSKATHALDQSDASPAARGEPSRAPEPGQRPRPASDIGVLTRDQEREQVRALITRICRECPRRQPTSEDEARASRIVEEEFRRLGLRVREHTFFFTDNLYKNVLLHAAPAVVGTAISEVAPALALPLHLLPALSYYLESNRKAYLGRRLLPWRPSRNVLGILPAQSSPPRLRLVLCAHVDAAFTGFFFWPEVLRLVGRKPPLGQKWLHRAVALLVWSQFALAGMDLARMMIGPAAWFLRPLEVLLTVPSLFATAVHLDIVLRNEVVPGANDDLSGVAALVVLAQRLARNRHPDVELVFVATGCEEASLGGGDAIARDFDGEWDKSRTVVLAFDGLGNGQLRYLVEEGEVTARRIPRWLQEVCDETSRSEPRFAGVTGFEVPVGGSDISAFLARGWEGVCLAAVDPAIGAPRHYHMPTDTPDNLNYDEVMDSIDYAERLIQNIVKRRLG